MDISIKPFRGSRDYYYGNTKIKGVFPNEILADKISVISSDMIFRRSKDFIDIYALSQCVEVNTADITDTCNKAGRIIKDFNAFNNRQSDLEHSYNKLKGIGNKPLFDEVYSYMKSFVLPFSQPDKYPEPMIWSSSNLNWYSTHNSHLNESSESEEDESDEENEI